MGFWGNMLGLALVGGVGYAVTQKSDLGAGPPSPANILGKVQKAHGIIIDALEMHEEAMRYGSMTAKAGMHLEEMVQKARESTPGTYKLDADPYVKGELSKVNNLYNEIIPPLVRAYAPDPYEKAGAPLTKAKQRGMLKRLERVEEHLRAIRVGLADE